MTTYFQNFTALDRIPFNAVNEMQLMVGFCESLQPICTYFLVLCVKKNLTDSQGEWSVCGLE